MKIAYVYDAVYPWETGGVQKRVWELARRLADRHDVHWYGLHYWDGPAVIEREGVTLHGVAEPKELYVDGRRSISEALAFGAALLGPLRSESFDLIDCQAFPYFSCFAARYGTLFRDTKLVVTWHEVWQQYWFEYLGRKGVFGKAVERLTTVVPDRHVAVSERTRRDLQSLGVDDARLVPNGIDVRTTERTPCVDRDVDVLFVGRLIKEKNAALLVQSLAALRTEHHDLECLLVGEGPEQRRIERLVERLDLDGSVTLLGFRESHDEILGLMKAADVFVLPSRREGFGMTALEAMACGTPTVTITHPQNAAADLVEHGKTGAVCKPEPEALATAIRTARELPAEGCVDAASQYDWDNIVDRIETVYRQLESESRGESPTWEDRETVGVP